MRQWKLDGRYEMHREAHAKRTLELPGIDKYFEPKQKKARQADPRDHEPTDEGGEESCREENIVVQPTMPLYFTSSEARRLFGLTQQDDSVMQKIEQRIDRLYRANRDATGWRDVVKGHDPFNACTAHDIFCLQKRSQYIAIALHHAKHNMPTKTWLLCCEFSIQKMSEVGCHFILTAESVRTWHHTFQSNGDRFPHPHSSIANGKDPDPPIFAENPALKRVLLNTATATLYH